MKKIQLTQGKVALVDDSDYKWLNQWKWCARQDGHTYYALHNISVAKNKQKTVLMHRLILGLQPSNKRLTDHKDGNGLNNQQTNLRVCTKTQNQHSRRKHKVGTSRYKGVYRNLLDCKWRSYIQVNGKQRHLGVFDSETVAAAAYNNAALKHYGEFALLNTL